MPSKVMLRVYLLQNWYTPGGRWPPGRTIIFDLRRLFEQHKISVQTALD